MLRRAVRVARSLVASPPASPQVPAELLVQCRMVPSRVAMLEHLPHGGLIAELGTLHGTFAAQILRTCRPRELHIVDVSFRLLAPEVAGHARVRLHNGTTAEMMRRLPIGLDWVYVDADHSEAAVYADATAAAERLRPGGLLVFNDFAHIDPRLGRYGVHRAVTRFAVERGWPFVLWAYEGDGLYDVALRKPG